MNDVDVGPEALDLLTVEEVAARLRCSPQTVRRLISSGKLESVKLETLRRVEPEAVIAYKRSLRASQPGGLSRDASNHGGAA